MSVTSNVIARPAYYDRNATGTRQRYNQSLAPHSYTQRWITTVASGKKAFVEAVFGRVFTNTVATAVGFSEGNVETSDGVTATLLVCARYLTSTTAKLQAIDRVAGTIILYPSNTIYANTSDDSTGGTIQYTIDALFTIFDA